MLKQTLFFSIFLVTCSSFAQKGKSKYKDAYFASGCFWCVEAIFETVKGVDYAESGYTGGSTKNPTYEAICTGKTGHAETVKVHYDTTVISYKELLRVFFNSHDPSTLNKQGPDAGTQYRSAIFYSNSYEKTLATDYIKQLKKEGKFKTITTQVEPLTVFYKAEAYHQDFEKNNPDNPYIKGVSHPRMDAFKKKSKDLLKKKN
ncbi:MAG: peptide-methionine (S)-S-oxide reductase MsrA [Flavobacteriales bacterium]|nr:peptide-methionine (S)-S-oxide reductase MsrA [Flavobacteriales bacterium]